MIIMNPKVKEEEMDDESPPPLPIRPTPTSLFQPFLPRPQHHSDKPLPFSIDNILRPTFGRNLWAASPFLSSSFMAAAAFAAAAAQAAQATPTQTSMATPLSPTLSTASSNSSTPTPIKREEKHHHSRSEDPVDLTKNNNNDNNNSSSKSDTNELPDGLKRDEDCPPGMVRGPNGQLWPAWVFCTRYSDRPSSGPRSRRIKKREPREPGSTPAASATRERNEEKRPRTAFSAEQLARLKKEFEDNRYLTEERRRNLATELGLNENQIKIWFQNKRAKIKKSSGQKGELAQMLMAQGLYNHSTVPVDDDDNPIY